MNELVQTIHAHEAMVNVTYDGKNFDLPNPVAFDANQDEIKAWTAETMRAGNVPGVPAYPNVDLTNFVVEKFPRPTNPVAGQTTFNKVLLYPKTAYGNDVG